MTDVVYVDDETMLCRVFGRILEGAGFEVRTFSDPREALAFINAQPPSLVLCDQRMPQMTGLELLDRLEVRVPFALITGELTVQGVDPERVLTTLSKPVSPEDLIAFVRGVLE